MGVERAVTRWYLHRQRLIGEIALLEAKLNPPLSGDQKLRSEVEQAEIVTRLASLHAQLRTIGPCPKAMMG